MSALMNYIHLYRENYLEHGTHQIKEQQSNYDNAIFQRFRDKIIDRAQKLVAVDDINALTAQYNESRNNKIEALKKIQQSNPAEYQKFIDMLLNAADLDKKYSASEVAKYIGIDINTGSLVINQKVMSDPSNTISIPKISKSVQYSYLDTLLSHIEIAYKKITLLKDATVKANLNKKLSDIEKQLNTLKTQVLKEEKLLEEIVIKSGNQKKSFPISNTLIENKNGRVILKNDGNINLAYDINQEIIQIASVASLSSVLSNLKGAFEEVLGTVSAPMIEGLVDEAIERYMNEIVKEFNQKGAIGKKTSNMGITGVSYLNQKELKKEAYKNFVTTTKDGFVTFELNYDTKNKVDFVITYNGQDIGVSSKAVDLSKTDIVTKDGKNIPAHITLQSGTNLLSYLIKAQELMDKMGTHFLNVYATEETANSSYLRDVADEALLIYLLYTGLSGDILKQADAAGLLYVYDTGKMSSGASRVQFFNVKTIIGDLLEKVDSGMTLDKYMYVSPDLNSVAAKLSAANRKVNDYDTMGENISARLTRVVGEARQQIFTVGLLNSYLVKNLIK